MFYSREFRDTDTKCPKCKTEMVVGQAIEARSTDNVCTGFGVPMLNKDTLRLIECLKCPECGHSDDLN